MSNLSSDYITELVLKGKLVDCGELSISRSTPNKARGKARYLIYLPVSRNYLWELLWKNKGKVRVFIEILS